MSNGPIIDIEQELFRRLEGDHAQERENGILTPDATLMNMLPDSPDDHLARAVYGGQVKRVLTELSAKRQRFYAKSSVDILFTGEDEDGRPEEYLASIKIRSIPEHVIEAESRAYQEVAAEMPYRLNPTTGEHEADRDDPQFITAARRLVAAQRELMYAKLLHGLDMPVIDENGNVVWSPNARTAQNKEEATRVLTDVMGITSGQITLLVEAIDALTEGVSAKEDEKLEKK